MNILNNLIERRNEALAGRGEVLTSLERAVVYYESEGAADELHHITTALEICIMFLTNVNTITPEKQAELCKHLAEAQMTELASAVVAGGFESALNEGVEA